MIICRLMENYCIELLRLIARNLYFMTKNLCALQIF